MRSPDNVQHTTHSTTRTRTRTRTHTTHTTQYAHVHSHTHYLAINRSTAASGAVCLQGQAEFDEEGEEEPAGPWLCCDLCNSWIVAATDGITDVAAYDSARSANSLAYSCPACRKDRALSRAVTRVAHYTFSECCHAPVAQSLWSRRPLCVAARLILLARRQRAYLRACKRHCTLLCRTSPQGRTAAAPAD